MQILDDALEGYNVCLLGYGRAGTGKTFSLYGDSANKGIVPRMFEEIFR